MKLSHASTVTHSLRKQCRAMPNDVGGGGDRAIGVRATYDAVAAAYDAAFADELQHKPLDRALLTSFAELAGSGTICDIGCGPGHITQFLAHRHADVVGLDISPMMVEIARRRAPRIHFMVGSILNLPLADNAWAGAVSLYSTIHLMPSERSTACHEFARVISARGMAVAGLSCRQPRIRQRRRQSPYELVRPTR